MNNVLYYGDNIDILPRYIDDESVDLIYLDPPFKSDDNAGRFAEVVSNVVGKRVTYKKLTGKEAKEGLLS